MDITACPRQPHIAGVGASACCDWAIGHHREQSALGSDQLPTSPKAPKARGAAWPTALDKASSIAVGKIVLAFVGAAVAVNAVSAWRAWSGQQGAHPVPLPFVEVRVGQPFSRRRVDSGRRIVVDVCQELREQIIAS